MFFVSPKCFSSIKFHFTQHASFVFSDIFQFYFYLSSQRKQKRSNKYNWGWLLLWGGEIMPLGILICSFKSGNLNAKMGLLNHHIYVCYCFSSSLCILSNDLFHQIYHRLLTSASRHLSKIILILQSMSEIQTIFILRRSASVLFSVGSVFWWKNLSENGKI